LSMGLSCSDKEYNRRADMAFVDQINTLHVVDDLLRFDRDFPADVKRRMRPPSGGPEGRHHFKSREVSVRPVKGVVGGIRDPTWRGQLHGWSQQVAGYLRFPRPNTITALSSFMGLVELLIRCHCRQRPVSASLSSRNPYIWTADQEMAFEAVKAALLTIPILTHSTWSQLARQHATSNSTCWHASTLQQVLLSYSPVRSDFCHSPRRHPVRLRCQRWWLPEIY
jgi:hypothetical protein